MILICYQETMAATLCAVEEDITHTSTPGLGSADVNFTGAAT